MFTELRRIIQFVLGGTGARGYVENGLYKRNDQGNCYGVKFSTGYAVDVGEDITVSGEVSTIQGFPHKTTIAFGSCGSALPSYNDEEMWLGNHEYRMYDLTLYALSLPPSTPPPAPTPYSSAAISGMKDGRSWTTLLHTSQIREYGVNIGTKQLLYAFCLLPQYRV